MRAAVILTLAALILISSPLSAQEITLSLGEDERLAGRAVQLIAVVTVLSVLPGLAVTITCFPFILTVLSILRQAIGLQQSPPNMMMVALALFLTWFVMEPVFNEAWDKGIGPFSKNEMELAPAIEEAMKPFRSFMIGRIDPETFRNLDTIKPREDSSIETASYPLILSSFILSELQTAFKIGFVIYLPFLVIDLVVSAVLMSMGMMMLSPVMISLPFKLIFFVAVDGWAMITTALVHSYL